MSRTKVVALGMVLVFMFIIGGVPSNGYASDVNVSATVTPGRIVAANDDWTLSDSGFKAPNDAATFAQNVAAWFTGGAPGSFLVYSTHFGLTGAKLAATMTSAGHQWTVDTTTPFTLANLQKYNGVFLGVQAADNEVLIDYVKAGGNVYVFSGDSNWATPYNAFLGYFGLKFGKAINGLVGNVPISSSHPLFAGVHYLYHVNGTSIFDLDPMDTHNRIVATYAGKPLFAVYDPDYRPDINGCISVSGTRAGNRLVTLSQTGESDQTTRTDANGCYYFDSAVSGKNFQVLIKGPVVP